MYAAGHLLMLEPLTLFYKSAVAWGISVTTTTWGVEPFLFVSREPVIVSRELGGIKKKIYEMQSKHTAKF